MQQEDYVAFEDPPATLKRISKFQLQRIVSHSTHHNTMMLDEAALLCDDLCCIICMDGNHEAVLMECGHSGICSHCAGQLWVSRNRRCPLCRARILAVMCIVNENSAENVVSSLRTLQILRAHSFIPLVLFFFCEQVSVKTLYAPPRPPSIVAETAASVALAAVRHPRGRSGDRAPS